MKVKQPQTLWRWLCLRILTLAIGTVLLIALCMWLRFTVQYLWTTHRMPEAVLNEFLTLREHPELNPARYHEIIDKWWGISFSSPSIASSDWLTVGVLVLVTIPFIAYFGLRHARPLSAQFSQLRIAADEVTDGHFGAQAELTPEAPAELVQFAQNFNAMTRQLARYEKELRASHVAMAHELRSPLTAAMIHALEAQGVVIQLANRQFLDEKSEGAVHQGIIARVKPGRQYQENDLPDLLAQLDQPFLLILDGVTDPHNLGACLRSADAAGVHAVIVPKDRSAQLNATAKKVACGAAENVPLIRVTNLARTMRLLQEENVWIVGTAGEADHTLFQSKMTGPMALVMGAEGEGMRRLTREHCDELISIPMAGSVSSLNVSVATGICLFEAVRQRS